VDEGRIKFVGAVEEALAAYRGDPPPAVGSADAQQATDRRF